MAETLATYSPAWWLRRLTRTIVARRSLADEFQAFYDGRQPLAFASDKFRETFGKRYGRLPANFMPLVVDAERERLIIQGFRFGNKPESDKAAWRIWQDNQMDAESQIAHELALVKGVAYAMVAPGDDGPIITIEDPCETVVETAPGNRRLRLAALKVWRDDDDYLRAYLFVGGDVYKYRSPKPTRTNDWTGSTAESVKWEPYAGDGEDFPATNPLGVVPIVPLLNRPRRDGSGRSEIEPVMGNQLAINQLRFNSLVAAEYVAFPQRWVTNIDIPIDPDTGQPIAPFKPGVDMLWALRRPTPAEAMEYGDRVPTPALGQFPAGDLGPYIEAIREEVGEMASISRTPYHYLLGEPTSVPPSGESLKSSEAPLVKKVTAESVHLGEGWEETMRLALTVAGQASKARSDAETIWADPETRNEAARSDAIVKQFQAGIIPRETALEALGYSSTEIERILALSKAEEAAEPAAETPPVPTGLVNGADDEAGIQPAG